jgi:hypothetical protein
MTQQVDRDAVRTLAVAIGVRQAARQLGIPEPTVQAWSARGKWFQDPPKPPTITNPRGATIATTTPAAALAEHLTEHSNRSRLGLSKAITKASERFAELPSTVLVQHSTSKAVKDYAGAGAIIHSWNQENRPGSPLNLQVLSQNTVISINDK